MYDNLKDAIRFFLCIDWINLRCFSFQLGLVQNNFDQCNRSSAKISLQIRKIQSSPGWRYQPFKDSFCNTKGEKEICSSNICNVFRTKRDHLAFIVVKEGKPKEVVASRTFFAASCPPLLRARYRRIFPGRLTQTQTKRPRRRRSTVSGVQET